MAYLIPAPILNFLFFLTFFNQVVFEGSLVFEWENNIRRVQMQNGKFQTVFASELFVCIF